jgi:hypothetical protein
MEKIEKTLSPPRVASLHLRNEVDNYYGIDTQHEQRQNEHHNTHHPRQAHQSIRQIGWRRGRLLLAHLPGIPSSVRIYSCPEGL